MTPEVAEEGIVMSGEVADAVVFFSGRIDNGGIVVGKAGQVCAIFLGE